MKQDWTEQLRQRMEGYEEPAPEGLWEAIEQALQQQDAQLASPETAAPRPVDEKPPLARRVHMRRLLAVAASLLVLLSVGVSLLFVDKVGSLPSEKKMATSSHRQQTEPAPAAVSETLPSADELSARRQKLQRKLQDGRLLAADNRKETAVEEPVPEVQPEVPQEEPVNTANQQAEVSPEKHQTETAAQPASTETVVGKNAGHFSGGQQPRPQGTHRSVTAGLRGANLLAANGPNAVTTLEPYHMTRGKMNDVMYNSNETMLSSEPIYLADYSDDTEHQHPFMIGLSVSIPLTDRLWAETGVTYTRAKSTFTTHLRHYTTVYSQKLEYLGLPVGVGYTFWRSHSFLAYVAGGAQLDFNVNAQLETDGLRSSVEKDRLMFSVNGHAGAEYQFLPHFGVYLEPGLRYYFDNRSLKQTVFKEKPLQAEFQLGVRYRLQ